MGLNWRLLGRYAGTSVLLLMATGGIAIVLLPALWIREFWPEIRGI